MLAEVQPNEEVFRQILSNPKIKSMNMYEVAWYIFSRTYCPLQTALNEEISRSNGFQATIISKGAYVDELTLQIKNLIDRLSKYEVVEEFKGVEIPKEQQDLLDKINEMQRKHNERNSSKEESQTTGERVQEEVTCEAQGDTK